MRKEQKIKEVESLKKKFAAAKAVIFAENKGLKVGQVTDLRKELNKEKATMKVVKNRLLKRALNEAKISGLDPYIKGILTVTASETEPVTTAKILVKFAKENEALAITGGFVYGKAVPLKQIQALADLPSKEELYRMVLRCLTQPATQVANILAAVPRQLVTVLNAIKNKKEQAPPPVLSPKAIGPEGQRTGGGEGG